VFQTSTTNMIDSHIIQWNCMGLWANYNQISLLGTKYNPVAVCLQENNIPSSYINTFRSYSLYQSPQIRTYGHPCGRVTLIQNNIPHTALTITSPLQVAALRITSFRPITVCSIYLPPHSNWNDTDLSITQQLPPLILSLGDLDAHNTVWSCQTPIQRASTLKTSLWKITCA
jgi:hypothetical protein